VAALIIQQAVSHHVFLVILACAVALPPPAQDTARMPQVKGTYK
jgi:hypothetical protein